MILVTNYIMAASFFDVITIIIFDIMILVTTYIMADRFLMLSFL